MAEHTKDGQPPLLRVLSGGGAASRDREDDALLAAFLVGDDDAFGDLVRRHEDLVLRIVRRFARDPDDARDLVQRTFVRAFQAARRTLVRRKAGALPFRRWLVRIAVNLSKNHLRDATRWMRAPLEALDGAAPSAAAGGTTPAAPAPDAALARAEAQARVRRAVAALPTRQREVLVLRIDADLPFAEVAAALGITENAAKVSFHHATGRLRALLAEEDRT